MSALLNILQYDSNSENSDDEIVIETKHRKFPKPDLSKVVVIAEDTHIDDPEAHSGKVRSFPHVRGNWATFVFIEYPIIDELDELINKILVEVSRIDNSCQLCEKTHISLSRTFVLNFHQITPLVSSLRKSFDDYASFELTFDSIKVYSNEENTRTFIALTFDYFSQRYLLDLTSEIDKVLQEFKQPTFYDDPSFHMSILWINGNKQKELSPILDTIQNYVSKAAAKTLRSVIIDKINCKSGNKEFNFYLK